MAMDSVSCRLRVDSALRISLFGVRHGARLVGHRLSGARNQACVQLVRLRNQALGARNALMRRRIDHEHLQVSLDQRRDQLSRIAADRLESPPPADPRRRKAATIVSTPESLFRARMGHANRRNPRSSQVEPTSTPAERDTSIMGLVLSYTRARRSGPCDCSEQTQPASGTKPEDELVSRQSPHGQDENPGFPRSPDATTRSYPSRQSGIGFPLGFEFTSFQEREIGSELVNGFIYNAGPGDPNLTNVYRGISDAPEASTWAMMMIGFAGIAYAAFRRARVQISLA